MDRPLPSGLKQKSRNSVDVPVERVITPKMPAASMKYRWWWNAKTGAEQALITPRRSNANYQILTCGKHWWNACIGPHRAEIAIVGNMSGYDAYLGSGKCCAYAAIATGGDLHLLINLETEAAERYLQGLMVLWFPEVVPRKRQD